MFAVSRYRLVYPLPTMTSVETILNAATATISIKITNIAVFFEFVRHEKRIRGVHGSNH